ncbi:MAG TPA: hypothetical protein VGP72_30550 [Planctomycetota bacterium]
MNTEDVTLQELIVRALTGRDQRARQSLQTAAASDPELERFCAELQGVVSELAGTADWLSSGPSAELTAKIRQAVIAKLPAAPPHFRTVLLEADLGRRSAARRALLVLVAGVVCVAALLYLWQRSPAEERRLKLTGKSVFESSLQDGMPRGWQKAGEQNWLAGSEGLHTAGNEESGALYYKEGFAADAALALDLDLHVPELGELSSAMVFLADGNGEDAPALDASSRPRSALALEIAADSLVLNGPGRTLLQSRPETGGGGRFYRLRIEYLGSAARVLINNAIFYDGPVPQPRGPFFAGLRVAGPKKNEIRFNTLRLER